MEQLLAENARLGSELEEQRRANAELRKLHDALTLQLARLQRQLFGQKAERVPTADAQMALTGVLEALGRLSVPLAPVAEGVGSDEKAPETPPKKPKKATPHGRRDVSAETLPVVTLIIEPAERSMTGGESLQRIGQDISHHIDYRPARLSCALRWCAPSTFDLKK